MRIKNFLFHRVSDEVDRLWPPMSQSLFERVIRHLSKNYQVLLLEDILNDPGQVKLRSKKIATIQFDDGYKDNIENAVPILKKYNCPASFYVVSACIDSGMPTWTYLLDHALQHTQIKELQLPFDFVPAEKKSIRENSTNKLSELAKPIKPWLKKIPNNQRVIVLNAILEQCKDVSIKKTVMMDWNDIRKLIQGGFYVGSHSHSHPLLASIETEEEIIFELETSARRIGQESGRRPVTISYPIGSYDERVVRLAKDCGYKYGLAVEQKFFQFNENLILEIPRVELYQEPFWKVYMRISGAINLFRNGGK
jgi:peptidoglycan/xylan/chitin deacetylase (PgdA/CDA1 family)